MAKSLGSVLVRDTKADAILRFPAADWRAFVTAVQQGEFAIATKI